MLYKRFADSYAVVLNDKLIGSILPVRRFRFFDGNGNLAFEFRIFYRIARKSQKDLEKLLPVAEYDIMFQT